MCMFVRMFCAYVCVCVCYDLRTDNETKQRNLHRIWDVAYDGYCGGKDMSVMKWSDSGVEEYIEKCNNVNTNFDGASIICVPILTEECFKSPMPLCNYQDKGTKLLATSDLHIHDIQNYASKQISCNITREALAQVHKTLQMHNDYQIVKDACEAVGVGETTQCRLLYKGTSNFKFKDATNKQTFGCGHHGHDYVGVAAVRNGKSLMAATAPHINISTVDSGAASKPKA